MFCGVWSIQLLQKILYKLKIYVYFEDLLYNFSAEANFESMVNVMISWTLVFFLLCVF